VVVRDFDFVDVSVIPAKAQSILFVDAYAVLALAIALKKFQPVAGRDTKVVEFHCSVELSELTESRAFKSPKRGTEMRINSDRVSESLKARITMKY
jgi:hypothetical protein